ncbi:MAG: hypothetical protein VKK04_25615 [Synechococcales bacterium]|nr:hypothetical protein [Synechococcales bacterium]
MSKRIQVTLPDRLAEDLERWADYEGRSLANLCAYLLENSIRESKVRGDDWARQQDSEKRQ